jgi:parvulin-like peptidyl-prolyl isomerase
VTRLPALALLVLVALVALTGCGGTNVAATVGDQTITISDLQAETQELSSLLSEEEAATADVGGLQQALLERQINHLLLSELAAREDVTVADSEVDALIRTAAEQQGEEGIRAFQVQNGYTDEGLRRAAQDALVARALNERLGDVQTAVIDLADEVGVEVNPRYGTWEGAALQPGTGSISVPPSATATAG